jgi:hypothetical protein
MTVLAHRIAQRWRRKKLTLRGYSDMSFAAATEFGLHRLSDLTVKLRVEPFRWRDA